ncbi:MAG: XrtA/PEP-CTERM system-associated ATPase [Pseudomonadota bacterium]
MYQEFYRLTESPFRLSPDARYFLALGGHRKALAYLRYGLQKREGLIVVTGVPGTGKTTIARLLVAEAAREGVVVSQLNTTRLDSDNVIEMVAAAFGLPHDGRSKAFLLTQLEAFFLARARAGKHLLLLVDEAQNLPVQSLEELRMLSNFQLGNHALLQIFLLGQQQFREMLQLPDMEQLRQRVVAACHLEPLNRDETREYIEHRLRLAGWTGDPTFTGDAVDSVFQATRGIPRNINTFCERVLLFGALEGLHTVNRAVVLSVVHELRQEAAEATGVAPLAAELTSTQESLAGGITNGEVVPDALTSPPANPFALDLSLAAAVAPSAATRTPPAVMAMHALPGVMHDSQSMLATMTGPSGAMGLPSTMPVVETPLPPPVVTKTPPQSALRNAVEQMVARGVAAAPTAVKPNATVTASREVRATDKVTAPAVRPNVPQKPVVAPPDASSIRVQAKPEANKDKPSVATASTAPVASPRPSAPVVARETPPTVAPPKPVARVEQPISAVPTHSAATADGAERSKGAVAPVVKAPVVVAPPPAASVTAPPIAAARKSAAPKTTAVVSSTAEGGEEEDDIPVLTMEDHAFPRSLPSKNSAVTEVKAAPAKKPADLVAKTPSTPEAKITPKPASENPQPSMPDRDKIAAQANVATHAAEPAAKQPTRTLGGGATVNKPATGGGGRISLAPAPKPAVQTTRLPSPLQRLLLVAEQVQANPAPTEAIELVASALLEPLPELLQFALSKEPLNEEWSAALTNRAPGEVRELARHFIKTVILAPASDLYQVLCLTHEATDEQIQANYRTLFKLLQAGPGNEVHPAAAARLNHAYQVLRDPARRLAYEISPHAVEPEPAALEAPISAVAEAKPFSAVDAVAVELESNKGVERAAESDEHEEEDEEVASETHWLLPRPTVLIGVGVMIAAVFAILIWQLTRVTPPPAEEAAVASASTPPPRVSVPSPAETKPAIAKETASLGGGVAAPVTHADLQILVKKLTSYYERGNIDNFATLFDVNVKTEDGSGVAGIRSDYQQLFKDTRRRTLDILNLRWQFSGPTAKGNGDFRVTIVKNEGNEQVVSGKISLQVAKMGEQAYITGMDYKYESNAQ